MGTFSSLIDVWRLQRTSECLVPIGTCARKSPICHCSRLSVRTARCDSAAFIYQLIQPVQHIYVRVGLFNVLVRILPWYCRGLDVEHADFAKQIVGFESAAKAAVSKIEKIRNQHPVSGPVVAVQSFIAEISDEKWDHELHFFRAVCVAVACNPRILSSTGGTIWICWCCTISKKECIWKRTRRWSRYQYL